MHLKLHKKHENTFIESKQVLVSLVPVLIWKFNDESSNQNDFKLLFVCQIHWSTEQVETFMHFRIELYALLSPDFNDSVTQIYADRQTTIDDSDVLIIKSTVFNKYKHQWFDVLTSTNLCIYVYIC